VETHIAILNGNGIHNPAHSTRSVVAMNNFSNCRVDRTVIYYYSAAELEAAPRLAGRIGVKVVMGPQQPAAASQAHVPRL
jgi:hypothetical protein